MGMTPPDEKAFRAAKAHKLAPLCSVCHIFPEMPENDRGIKNLCGKCYLLATESAKAQAWQMGVQGDLSPPEPCPLCGGNVMTAWSLRDVKPFDITKIFYVCPPCNTFQTAWPRIGHEEADSP